MTRTCTPSLLGLTLGSLSSVGDGRCRRWAFRRWPSLMETLLSVSGLMSVLLLGLVV